MDLIPLFKSIGLNQAKAAEASKSPKSAAILQDLIAQNNLVGRLDEKQAVLVAAFAVQLVKVDVPDPERRTYVIDRIISGKLTSVDQVSVATKYIAAHDLPIVEQEFNRECGVGFTISPSDLLRHITQAASAATSWADLGTTIGAAKLLPALRWANPLDVKTTVESLFKEKFGAKEVAKPKGKKEPNTAPKSGSTTTSPTPKKSVFEEGFLGQLHKPGENPQIHPHLREEHLSTTGGAVWTRFPPEPNGYLHIGHSKAIFVNFGYAAHHGGKCYLRYDDTNPEKEEGQYFESILETIRWLGFEPWKVTYSSDHFQKLYDLAVELIKRDKAYVCHCTQAEIKVDRGESRGQPRPCKHRDRPISESLREFEAMKEGKYRPKEANLRMKQDLNDPNPQMWDLTAYRVLESPHHRTGSTWKIYPTYDFTHCLCDSFENISHSLCTTEFVASRQSYDWLCDALEVYKPRQSEYGRLNLEGTIMSKRKILALVNGGHVSGWDDPRLYTLIALRRRGIPPGAILSFVSTLGVSTAPSNTETARFEYAVRQYLENSAPRLLMVMRPLKVTIENLAEDYLLLIDKALHPKVPELGTTSIPFTRTIYIERDDFRLEDTADYFRLAPGKTVGLFQGPHPITCTSYKTDPVTGEVVELICRLEDQGTVPKPKAYIQWVAEHKELGSPVRIDETRIFHRLFKSDLVPSDQFLTDLNPDSVEVIKTAIVEVGFWPLAKRLFTQARREGQARTTAALRANEQSADGDTPRATSEQLMGNEVVRFQGLRIAYFALDKDAEVASLRDEDDTKLGRREGDFLVLNRVVSLKEDSGKTG